MKRPASLKLKNPGFYFLLLSSIFFSACPKDQDVNFKPALNVFCVINPRGLVFRKDFVIDRTYAIDEEAVYDLENALVVVRDRERSETLLYIGGNQFQHPYKYNLGFDTCQTLRLMVAVEGLDTLWGETTVPGGFQILSPAPGDTFGPEDTLIFTKSHNALMYAINWNYVYGSYNFYFPDYLPDSMYKIPIGWLIGDYPPAEGFCHFEIAAYDSNYAEYKMHWETNTYPRYGVTGGLGVFGSALTKIVSFYYRP